MVTTCGRCNVTHLLHQFISLTKVSSIFSVALPFFLVSPVSWSQYVSFQPVLLMCFLSWKRKELFFAHFSWHLTGNSLPSFTCHVLSKWNLPQKNMNGEKWKRGAEILVILFYFRHFSIVCSAFAISACQYLALTTLLFTSLVFVKEELKIAINENWSARAVTVATMDSNRQCLLYTRLQSHSIPTFNSFSFSLLKWK